MGNIENLPNLCHNLGIALDFYLGLAILLTQMAERPRPRKGEKKKSCH